MATDINYPELLADMQQRFISRVFVNDDETYATYRTANAKPRKCYPLSLHEVKERAGIKEEESAPGGEHEASVPGDPSNNGGDSSGGEEAGKENKPEEAKAAPEPQAPAKPQPASRKRSK